MHTRGNNTAIPTNERKAERQPEDNLSDNGGQFSLRVNGKVSGATIGKGRCNDESVKRY